MLTRTGKNSSWPGRIAISLLALLTLYIVSTSHQLVAEGRVGVGIAERKFIRDEIAHQTALGKSNIEIFIIGIRSSPYADKFINDEFFTLTAQNIGSMFGMMELIKREMSLTSNINFFYHDDYKHRDIIMARAVACNCIVIDFRQFRPAH